MTSANPSSFHPFLSVSFVHSTHSSSGRRLGPKSSKNCSSEALTLEDSSSSPFLCPTKIPCSSRGQLPFRDEGSAGTDLSATFRLQFFLVRSILFIDHDHDDGRNDARISVSLDAFFEHSLQMMQALCLQFIVGESYMITIFHPDSSSRCRVHERLADLFCSANCTLLSPRSPLSRGYLQHERVKSL